MIAVDTSALMAILLGEPTAEDCMDAIAADPDVIISAGTVAEALIVASRRNVGAAMRSLIERLHLQILPVTAASAIRVADAYGSWGKGVHPAGLNFGDCFAYEAAMTHGCRLLYVGDDFARTDVSGVLPAGNAVK